MVEPLHSKDSEESLSPAQIITKELMELIPNHQQYDLQNGLYWHTGLAMFLRLNGLSANTIKPVVSKGIKAALMRRLSSSDETLTLSGEEDIILGSEYTRTAYINRVVLAICEDDHYPKRYLPTGFYDNDSNETLLVNLIEVVKPYFPNQTEDLLGDDEIILDYSNTQSASMQKVIESLANALFRPVVSDHGYGIAFGDPQYPDPYYPWMSTLLRQAKILQENEK